MLLPDLATRVRMLTGTGFTSLAFLIALVYRAVNILPSNHPYLLPANAGKYGMLQVIAEAANHLSLGWRNVDKLILYLVILAGLVILFMQFFILLMVIFASPALAQTDLSLATLFTTPSPNTDLAFRLLDRVFGIPNLFNSQEATLQPFHIALHSLFQFYSTGMLVIAVFILVYFIFAIVAETAETGTPFGKRFNHVWAPVRLVVAFGLLIPAGYGLNSGQWIALYAAKWGSGFATTGWVRFNETLEDSYLGKSKDMVAVPNAPDLNHLPMFMMVAKTCRHAYALKHGKEINAWLVKNPAEDDSKEFAATSYDEALKYFNNGDIQIRFGEKNTGKYTENRGSVYPYCGHMVLQTTDVAKRDTKPGSKIIQEGYYELMKTLWVRGDDEISEEVPIDSEGNVDNSDYGLEDYAKAYVLKYANIGEAFIETSGILPPPTYKDAVSKEIKKHMEGIIAEAIEVQRQDARWKVNKELMEYGWPGAAISLNSISELNGTMVSAIMNVPRPETLPFLMEFTKKKKLQQDKAPPPEEAYNPKMSSGQPLNYKTPGDKEIAKTMNYVFKYWQGEGPSTDNTQAQLTGNAMIDAINALLGTQGLFDICKNTNVHPLAQLSQVGKGLMESAIRNFGFSFFSGAFGGLAYLSSPHLGSAGFAAAGFFTTVASIGILIGFVLFYVLPFLPFLYFFFAVGGWIKGLFEAMVGIPLWALAHLRIDGEGLPGEAASNGYFLIFEIFIRPILIIFGFLASILVFTAMVKVLNEIYYIAVSNLSGFNSETINLCGTSAKGSAAIGSVEYYRGPIDEFFFTIMYTIIVYMIAMSSFKLIDLVPNNIMRWIGSGASGFNDLAGEPAEGLVQKIVVGGGILGSNLQQGVSALGSSGEGLLRFREEQAAKSKAEKDKKKQERQQRIEQGQRQAQDLANNETASEANQLRGEKTQLEGRVKELEAQLKEAQGKLQQQQNNQGGNGNNGPGGEKPPR